MSTDGTQESLTKKLQSLESMERAVAKKRLQARIAKLRQQVKAAKVIDEIYQEAEDEDTECTPPQKRGLKEHLYFDRVNRDSQRLNDSLYVHESGRRWSYTRERSTDLLLPAAEIESDTASNMY